MSALTEIADWGPFFAVDVGRTPSPEWLPLRDMLDHGVLAARVAAVRERLGGRVPVRVAASVTQFGLVARLVSPSLALFVHSGRSLAVGPGDAWWRPELGGAFPLSVTGRSTGSPAELLDVLGRIVLAAKGFSVSERVLWGNVASAVNGAATMIGVARPDLASRAIAVADDLLGRPPLRGTGVRWPDGRFRRASCCLIYRAAPGPRVVCGDCVLAG